MDGAFAGLKISKFDNKTYSGVSSIYNGSLATGLLRGSTNSDANAYLTRFPTPDNGLFQLVSRQPSETAKVI